MLTGYMHLYLLLIISFPQKYFCDIHRPLKEVILLQTDPLEVERLVVGDGGFTMLRRCSQQYVGKTRQPLHCRLNVHCYDIEHGGTEDSPVAAHFDNDEDSQADRTVMVIDEVQSHDPCL